MIFFSRIKEMFATTFLLQQRKFVAEVLTAVASIWRLEEACNEHELPLVRAAFAICHRWESYQRELPTHATLSEVQCSTASNGLSWRSGSYACQDAALGMSCSEKVACMQLCHFLLNVAVGNFHHLCHEILRLTLIVQLLFYGPHSSRQVQLTMLLHI